MYLYSKSEDMIQLAVFDMAGTTVRDENEVELCFSVACRETGIPISDERIKALQGWGKHQVFTTLWSEILGDSHPELVERARKSYDCFRDVLEEHYRTHPVVPTVGALEAFKFCREHSIKIALTTGFYRKVTDILLQQLGWLDGLDEERINRGNSVIDLSVCSEEVPKGRPAPFMIQKAMQVFGIADSTEVVNCGDTPSDLLSADAAGVALNIGLLNGTHPKHLLELHPHHILMDSMLDFPSTVTPYLH
jgi:phosphonatase-like hydrolase